MYAYTSELDAWRESRQSAIIAEPKSRRWIGVASAAALIATTSGLLLVARGPLTSRRTPNPEALRAYQQAEYATNAGRVQIQSGIRYYTEAIRLDPAFADAWSGLASAHVAQTWFSDLPARETMADAKRAAERALQIDPSLSGPWRVLGAVSHYHAWNHAVAEQQFRKAIELESDSSVALSWFAEFLIDLRRFDEAFAFMRRAQDATPRWLEPITVSGTLHALTGQPKLAVAEYRRALSIEPNFGLANHFLGRAYLTTGEHASALEQLRKSDELMGQLPFTRSDLGYALAMSGQREEAQRILSDLLRKREQGSYPAFAIAAVHMGLGDPNAAMTWLEHAADERHSGYYFPSADPIYDPLRSNLRFRSILERMKVAAN